MIPGFPTTVPPGGHDDLLLTFKREDNGVGTGAIVTLQAVSGYGDSFWALVVDGVRQSILYLPEDTPVSAPVLYAPDRGPDHVISACPLGDWDNDAGVDVSIQQLYFESDKGVMVQLDFDAVMETFQAYGDADQLSNWDLSGIARYATSRPHQRKTQAQIDITISNSGTTRTVTLSLNGYVLASGSRTGDGEITLVEQNDSGVSGTVDIAYTADVDEGDAYLIGRWAASYTVVVDDQTTTVYDNGLGNRLSAVLGPFSAGTYNYSITPISDTGITGTAASSTVTVPGRPEPPGVPAYLSGDWEETIIRFAGSDTLGATHRVYDSALNEPADLETVSKTAVTGAGPHDVTLNSLASAAAGIRRVVVESVLAGVESGVRRELLIEYDAAGAVVLPRPNSPAFQLRSSAPVTAGRTIHVEYSYDAAGQQGVATQVRLDLEAEDGTVSTGTPSALDTAVGSLSRGALSATASGDGWFKFRVVALTAGGVVSGNTEFKGPVPVSNTVLGAPGNVEVNVRA